MKRLTQTLAFCLLTVFTAVAQKNYVSLLLINGFHRSSTEELCI